MRYLLITLLLLSKVLFAGESQRIPPTSKVNHYIDFHDDLDFEYIQLAIKRQLASFNSMNLNVKFKFGEETFSRSDLKKTMEDFSLLVDKTVQCLKFNTKDVCYEHFSKYINTHYSIYRPIPEKNESGYQTNQSLFTAYYSPDLHGSRVKTDVYKNPIYRLPMNSALSSLTREEIDFDQKLAGKGLELFYVKESLYDIWLLHVEGGGRVQVLRQDGSVEMVYLSYAGSNKRSFTMLYKYMLEQNMLKPGQASIDNQRSFLEANPQVQREVFASCPSYIFFKESMHEPLGTNNIVLTENRSLATDYRRYKEYGILNFIVAKRPFRENGEINLKKFSRFFINQDTGGAIKGNARSDLYFGFGREAELTANSLKVLGDQYFLVKKK